MLGLFISYAVFLLICTIGIVLYRKHPKPPKDLNSYRDLYDYYYNHRWEEKKSIIEYVEAGEKLQAIKELRAQTGCSLADAKTAIEQLEISVKRRTTTASSKESDR